MKQFIDTMTKIKTRFTTAVTASRIILGTMATWILIIAFQADRSDPAEIVLDLAIFVVLLLTAYTFATVIGEEIIAGKQTRWKRFFEIVVEISPVALGAVSGLFIFTMAWLGFLTVKTGYYLIDCSLMLLLFVVGFLAGKAIGGILRGMLDGIIATGIGAGLVFLRSMIL